MKISNQASWKMIAHEIDARKKNLSVENSSHTDFQSNKLDKSRHNSAKEPTSESFRCRCGTLRKLLDLQQNW